MAKPFSLCTALITPYTRGGIDYKNLAYLIDRQIQGGADALLVNGTTAEPALLTDTEIWKQIKFVIDYADGRVPVLAGCGAVSTQKTLKNCIRAQELGTDYLLVVTPYYNKTSQEGAYAHYELIASKVDTPIILYNVPARTGFDLLPETVLKLSRLEHIAGLKQATADLAKTTDIFPALSETFRLYCGDDCNLLPMLSVGAWGLISVVSNVCPAFVSKVIREQKPLDFYTLKTVSDLCFLQTNPIPIKYIMHKLGLINEYYLRLPLCPLPDALRKKIDASLPLFAQLLKEEPSNR